MFTIDLLKGQGIPVKSGPAGLAIIAGTFAAPVIVAIVMFGCYLSNSIKLSVQKQQIAGYESKLDSLSDAMEFQKAIEKKKAVINNCLSEVASSVGRYTQWSPVLATLVENMPDSMVLTKLEVQQQSIRRKMPQKDDPKKTVDVSVPASVLRMNLSGKPQQSYGGQIRDFRDRLRSSTILGPKLENIKVSQETDKFDGQETVSYQVECIFKPQL
jgi:hypothetical protein